MIVTCLRLLLRALLLHMLCAVAHMKHKSSWNQSFNVPNQIWLISLISTPWITNSFPKILFASKPPIDMALLWKWQSNWNFTKNQRKFLWTSIAFVPCIVQLMTVLNISNVCKLTWHVPSQELLTVKLLQPQMRMFNLGLGLASSFYIRKVLCTIARRMQIGIFGVLSKVSSIFWTNICFGNYLYNWRL